MSDVILQRLSHLRPPKFHLMTNLQKNESGVYTWSTFLLLFARFFRYLRSFVTGVCRGSTVFSIVLRESVSISCLHACNEGQRIHQATLFFRLPISLAFRQSERVRNMRRNRWDLKETGLVDGRCSPNFRIDSQVGKISTLKHK